jgi:hypothetical protein
MHLKSVDIKTTEKRELPVIVKANGNFRKYGLHTMLLLVILMPKSM